MPIGVRESTLRCLRPSAIFSVLEDVGIQTHCPPANGRLFEKPANTVFTMLPTFRIKYDR